MTNTIKLECKTCGRIHNVPKVCKYTGFVYGRGWQCVCDECRGDLKPSPEDPPCDDDRELIPDLHPWRFFEPGVIEE